MTLVFAFLSFLACAQEEPFILVENGKSRWHIFPLDGDSALPAAQFIQAAIIKLTGVTLPIKNSKRGRSIVVGTRRKIKETYGRTERMFECKLPQDQVRGIAETHNPPELWDNEKEQMD